MDEPLPIESAYPTVSPRDQQREPLRLIYLLVWMTITAALFGIDRILGGSDRVADWHGATQRLFHYPCQAAGLGCLVLWCVRKQQQQIFPTQPGEWLLIAIGLSKLISLSFYLGITTDFFLPEEEDWAVISALLTESIAILLVAYFMGRSLWRWYLIESSTNALVIAAVGLSLMWDYNWLSQLMHIGSFLQVLGLVLVGLAMWSDSLGQRVYGWLHWVGVVASIVPILVRLKSIVGFYFDGAI